MEPMKSSVIAFRPSGNQQGGNYFLRLHTQEKMLGNNWIQLPIPNEGVDDVQQQAAERHNIY